MTACDACGASILFGGRKLGDLRFCNDRCAGRGQLLILSRQLPPDVIRQKTSEVFHGRCPKCQGGGPVDVHMSYRVWSALVLTSWQNTPHICCRSCGVKRQAGDAVLSLVVGWWGIPWGIVMTPLQIVRNIAGMLKASPPEPSERLTRAVSIAVASQIVQNRGPQAPSGPK